MAAMENRQLSLMSQDNSRNEGRKWNETNWEDEERAGRRKVSNTQTVCLPVHRPEIVPVDKKYPEAGDRCRQRPRGGDGMMERRVK